VICALNATRRNTNNFIRHKLDIRSSLPVVGDRVVALRNDYSRGLLNGTIWSVEQVVDHGVNLHLRLADDDGNCTEAMTPKACFKTGMPTEDVPRNLQPLDFGYCITCHKA
jgi:ATP-dependent exoDNAse (exonuclease V) alpha subunit